MQSWEEKILIKQEGIREGIAEGEKRTAITTDRAVEEKLPRHYCAVME